MSESQIVGFLGRKIYQAMNDEDGDLSDVRQENFNYYVGKPYGDERTGYSKFVTRETLETIEWALPSVLRVFTSGDRVVVFDPVGMEDEQAAEQETDITNHAILKGNRGKGFLALHHWFKDTLMNPNGYIKAYMEEAMHTDVGNVTGVDEVGLQMLVDDPDVEILEQQERAEVIEMPMVGPPAANPQQQQQGMERNPPMQQETITVYDLRVRTTKKVMELRLCPVPGEECLVDNDCVSLDLDEADFVCHRVRKSYTQLVMEGYDPDELDQVGLGEDYQWNDERTNRLFYEDEDPDAEDEDDPSMRTFWVHECYAWFDYDGDGIGEFRRVVLIGDRVFENEETNYQPMVAMSSILMPHKHNGMSYADIVKDLQILMSTLTRQLLDNTYKINVRRKVFSEDSLTEDGSTMDAMLNTQAEFIPVRGRAADAFVPEPTHSIIADILPVLQHFGEQTKLRTGVAPELSLDPDTLQESTLGAFMGALDQATQRIEMLVRIFAETGMKQLMLKVHQLLRQHQDIQTTVKIRGDWIPVDPQGWRDRTDMTVSVGLGFNNKQQQIGMLLQLLTIQKEAAAGGLANPQKLYNSFEKLVIAAGLGDVREYFVDPDSPEYQPPQPPPDPALILAEAQAQGIQADSQIKGMKTQSDIQTGQQKMQSDAAKSQADQAIKIEELKGKQLDRQLKARELALKEAELGLTSSEVQARIDNIMADTEVKRTQADKNTADAAATAVEAGEAFTRAKEIVKENDENGAERPARIQAETGTDSESE